MNITLHYRGISPYKVGRVGSKGERGTSWENEGGAKMKIAWLFPKKILFSIIDYFN